MQAPVTTSQQVCLVDKFFVPQAAREAFFRQMQQNRAIVAAQEGYVSGQVMVHPDADSNLTVLTTAVWKDEAALAAARPQILQAFERIHFSMPAFSARLGITLERSQYTLLPDAP